MMSIRNLTGYKLGKLQNSFLFICIALTLLSCSEAPYVMYPNSVDVIWKKTYDIAHDYNPGKSSILIEEDGSLVIAGYGYIMKANNDGDSLWAIKIEKGGVHFSTRGLIGTSDGGYLLIGSQQDTSFPKLRYKAMLGFETVFGFETYLVKMDSIGQILSYGLSEDYPQTLLYEVEPLDDAGFVAVSYSAPLLVRADINGDTVWTRSLILSDTDKYGRSVISTQDNNLLVAGYTALSIYPRLMKNWFAKFDYDGNLLWSSEYTLGCSSDFIDGIAESNNGDIVFATNCWDTLSMEVTLGTLAKTNSTGTMIWSKVYGQPSYTRFYDIAEVSPQRFAAVGYIFSEVNQVREPYIIIINGSGMVVKEISFGTEGVGDQYDYNFLDAISIDQSGNIVIAGSIANDLFLVKINSADI